MSKLQIVLSIIGLCLMLVSCSNDADQIFFENEDNPRCGLKSMSDPANGGYISMNRGYNEVSQNERAVVLECYLIHVISDLSGRSLNIYYPCKPDQIEWRGLLYNL